MSIIQGTSKSSGGGYEIDQSIRFNKSNSAYMHRTPSSATNQKTWTWSGWVKGYFDRSSGDIVVFGAGNSGGSYTTELRFQVSTEKLYFFTSGTGGTTSLISSSVYRDPTAWYHIVIAVDTTQSTSTDRIKIYVNGDQLTDFSTETYQAQNTNTALNSTNKHSIGKMTYASYYYPGYQAEMNFIDGLALAPTSFGEYNDDGVWIPKEYAGAYGTNGFYITGATAGDLGEDFSGNGHDFTSSGLAADDQVVDTPTDNYATLNPLNTVAPVVLSNGNLSGTYAGGAYQTATSGTISVNSGKWYWEVNVATVGASYIGLALADIRILGLEGTNTTFNSGDAYVYAMSGHKFNGFTAVAYGATYTSGDVVGVAFDADAGTLTFYKNNSSQGVAYTGLTSGPYMFIDFLYSGAVHNVNFGQLGFTYTPPVGFVALSTSNLPTPAIADGSTAFQTTLYTATGSALEVNQIGNSTFQPDFVWVKNRTSASGQMINDAVTGAQKFIRADSTAGQTTQTQGLVSFDADGFSVGTNGDFNYGTDSFVGWQWLAGNGTATNEVGTITSTVSVNTTAGFSIVRAASMAGSGGTIGHGLGTVPDMVIGRMQSETFNWQVWHQGLTNGTYSVHLNDTSAQAAVATVYTALPTSTLINTGASWTNGNPAFFYVFTGVEGYSKFGKYNGNGSTNGSFIYTGFKPAFVIFKRIDSADNWAMYDATRDSFNVAGKYLLADTNAAETTYSTAKVDFLSNGFKWRGAVNFGNNSGGTYIYMAFAEHPFGGDGVAPATAR